MKQYSESLLKRTGGWYLILVIAFAQLSAVPGAILGTLSISFNAGFDPQTMTEISRYTPFFILAGNLILLGIAWFLTPNARARLTAWARGSVRPDPTQELSAWREISSLTWRYGLTAVVVTYSVDIVPTTLYYYFIGTTTFDQLIYSLMGGLVSVFTIIIIAILVIDYLLIPPRLALMPRGYDAQLNGLSGARLGLKIQVLVLVLVAIGLLMIGPVGFHYMNESLTPANQFLRRAFQNEAIAVSLLALALGMGLAYAISRTISTPLRDLISTFKAVESGEISRRVEIKTTDEIAEVGIHFNRMVARLENLQTTLEQQVRDRTRQLTATIEVGRVASSILDPDQLLNNVAHLITEQFNYYYAAVYLLDPSEKWAELREATGEAGNVLKQNRHRLEVAGRSMVAASIRERMPRIAQNTADEKQRFENPLLPYTRSEISLPLIAGDRVLGALNVHSTKAADFGLEVIETMQNMASQVAIALENARLFQEAQQSIRELRSIQKQYLFEGWTGIQSYNEDLEYGIGEPSEAAGQVLKSPVSLRDQLLGEITLESRDEWTPEQQSLVDAVTTQAAIALENARLVSESRQIALRERTLAEINSRIWASPSIDGILQTVVRELGKRLDASSATIELSLEDEHDKP